MYTLETSEQKRREQNVLMSEQLSCTLCGVSHEEMWCCRVCRRSVYCSQQCFTGDAPHHKSICTPPPSLKQVLDEVKKAHAGNNWQGIVKWQWRFGDLLIAVEKSYTLQAVLDVVNVFVDSYLDAFQSTGLAEHLDWYIRLTERSIEILCSLKLFRTQGHAMCNLGHVLHSVGRLDDSLAAYTRAGLVAQQHGFLGVESGVFLGMGRLQVEVGCHEYGIKLLRNAVHAIDLSYEPKSMHVLEAQDALLAAMFNTGDMDGVEQMVKRFREAVNDGMLQRPRTYFLYELRAIVFCARLYQVPPSHYSNLQFPRCFSCIPLPSPKATTHHSHPTEPQSHTHHSHPTEP